MKRRLLTASMFGAGLVALVVFGGEAQAQCASDGDCKGGRRCSAGACVDTACTKDVDCPGDAVCSGGVCSSTAAPPAAPASAPYPPAAPGSAPSAAWPVGPVAHQAVLPPPKAEERTETRGIKGLYIAGPIILGTAYVLGIVATAAIGTATASEYTGQQTGLMAIPVAGPFVTLGADLDRDTADYAGAFIGAGALQIAGLTMTILGLSIRRETRVPVEGLMMGGEKAAVLDVGPSQVGDGWGAAVRLGPPIGALRTSASRSW